MKAGSLLALAAGVLIGAAAMMVFGPAPAAGDQDDGLIDGKYLVVQGESGHWVYEATPDGMKVVLKEFTPDGLTSIWSLQGEFQPQVLDTQDGSLVNVPATSYSTETGALQLQHRFYRLTEGKLVEVEIENKPAGK